VLFLEAAASAEQAAVLHHLDNLSQEQLPNLFLKTGLPIVYDMKEEGKVVGKELLA
jgi:bisphosphoglycerate-dependent phosphoglycerate mutase